MNLLKQTHRALKGVCKPGPFLGTQMNPDSAQGYLIKRVFRSQGLGRTKEDYYASCPNVVHWMKRWAWQFKIPVLWECSGKEEIRTQAKFDAGSVRTFTFADPNFTASYAHMIGVIKSAVMLLSCDFENYPVRLGVSFAHGGFTRMAKTLEAMYVVKGDCIKWDSNFTSVLKDANFDLLCYFLGLEQGSAEYEELKYYVDQSHWSFVRMPGGEILLILYKKSGEPWTTGGNSFGHLFILCDHILDICEATKLNPFQLYRACHFNIYSDDHLNGYTRFMNGVDLWPYLSHEWRARVYARVGQLLHIPPDDRVEEGPLGLTFLGAEVIIENGHYAPRYDYGRLLAILYCNEYSPKELEEVLISIAPLVVTNPKAWTKLISYLSEHFPHFISHLEDAPNVMSGAEGGIKMFYNKIKPQSLMNVSSNSMVKHPLNNTDSIGMSGISTPGLGRGRSRRSRGRNSGSRRDKPGTEVETLVLTERHTVVPPRGNVQRGRVGQASNSGPARNRVRNTPNTNIPRTVGLSRRQAQEVVNLVAQFIDPASHERAKLPDEETTGPTSTYQAKIVINTNGVTGTAVNLTTDKGRFCYAFNPIITLASNGFVSNQLRTQVSQISGSDNSATWPNRFVADTSNPFCEYFQDQYSAQWINTSAVGDMAKCRPVGMSVLASYDGREIEAAGDIAICLMPSGMWEEGFTNSNSSAQKLVNWENLARFPKAYDGKLHKGAYCWWRPTDLLDFLMRHVMDNHSSDSMVGHDYPFIVVAGKILDPTSSSILITVYINFEFTSSNRRFAGYPSPSDNMVLEKAMSFLKMMETAHSNEDHIDWMKVLLGGVAGFVLGGPVGAAVGAAAGAGLTLTGLLRSK